MSAKVLKHLRGDKVIVFKKKRRKGYRVKNGHRQSFTEIQIDSIIASGAKPSANKAEKATAKTQSAKAKPVEVKAPTADLDHTLHARVDGIVKFQKKKDNKSYVSIVPFES